jgi:diguanylate cyclase (GGDEF)-like protein
MRIQDALQNALDELALGVVVFDARREVVYCNKRYAEIYGLRPEQVSPGTPVGQLIRRRLELGLKISSNADDYVRKHTSGVVVPFAASQELSDGRIIAYSVSPIAGGGGVATHEDITEREELHRRLTTQHQLTVQQEEQLRIRALQFDLAINNMSQGLCFFDGSQRLIVCNSRYVEMYQLDAKLIVPGITLREIVDLRFAVGSFPKMTKEEYLTWRDSIAVSDKPSDTIVKLTNGRIFQLRHRPMTDGGWVATHEDITEREVALETAKRVLSELEDQNRTLHEREQELEETNRRFDIALTNMAQGLCMLDAQLRVVECNDRYRQLFKVPAHIAKPGAYLRDLVAYSVSEGRHPGQCADDVMSVRLAIFAKGEPATLRTKGVDGARTIETRYRPTAGGGWVATYDDITDRERAEMVLAEQNRRFDAALNNMPHGLSMFDADRRLIVCNRRFAEMYRLPQALTEQGTQFADILEHRVKTRQAPDDSDSYAKQMRKIGDLGKPARYRVRLLDGRTIQVDYEPMIGGGWVVTHQDVTETIRAEAQITHLARHDALTDLPNRFQFQEKLDEALLRVARGESVAVLCLDLDRFKAVNDTLGHGIGDDLLKLVAERLRAAVRDTDTVARLGGDEFAIIQPFAEQPTGATSLAARIIDTLTAPYSIADHQIDIGASIGVAIAPDDGVTAKQLLKNSDLALYRAKSDGRGVYRFFAAEMDAKMRRRRELEMDLRAALANGEFELFYQPLVNVAAREVIAFEALMRWRSPARGLVAPNEFIPLAEEIGLIAPIGAWVLKTACAEAATWPDHIKVAVNLSPVQFKSERLLLDIVSALGSSGLSPQRLELEITETVMLHDTDTTLATLHQIKALGVSISMDDFGTGYSSLSYLRKFPFDKIKIDQSFVREISDTDESMAVVRAVMGLGSSLGIATIAEGVETADQLRTLRAEGCLVAQGFLFSPAVPATEIGKLLERLHRDLDAA